VVAVKFVYVNEVVVFVIVVPAVAKLSNDDSHLTTLPVLPAKVNVAPFDPEHTVAAELTVPATVVGFTVIMTAVEVSEAHTPPVTLLLNHVDCVNDAGE
jgi:hypothetical protein